MTDRDVGVEDFFFFVAMFGKGLPFEAGKIDCAGGRKWVVKPLNDKANGFTGSSEYAWEPGSAMVPTFCVGFEPQLLLVGNARAGDGDLPLERRGEGGGEPNRESSCSSSMMSV